MKALFLVVAALSPMAACARSIAPPAASKSARKVAAIAVAPIPIVPGKSAGKIWLGAPRETVRRILGKPDATSVRGNSISVDQWLGAEVKDADGNVSQRRFAVIYRGDRAAQIELNSPRYSTAQGISMHSSLAQFRKFFRPSPRAYLYSEGGFRYYAYDDTRRGLAFAFGAQDSYDARVLPEILVIHRRGVRMIVNPGGEPITANDEISIRKTAR